MEKVRIESRITPGRSFLLKSNGWERVSIKPVSLIREGDSRYYSASRNTRLYLESGEEVTPKQHKDSARFFLLNPKTCYKAKNGQERNIFLYSLCGRQAPVVSFEASKKIDKSALCSICAYHQIFQEKRVFALPYSRHSIEESGLTLYKKIKKFYQNKNKTFQCDLKKKEAHKALNSALVSIKDSLLLMGVPRVSVTKNGNSFLSSIWIKSKASIFGFEVHVYMKAQASGSRNKTLELLGKRRDFELDYSSLNFLKKGENYACY